MKSPLIDKEIVKTCKIHGVLTKPQCVFHKSVNFYACKECRNERSRELYKLNIEKERVRAKQKDLKLKNTIKKDKICKIHGLITPQEQTLRHQCKLCRIVKDNKYASRSDIKEHKRLISKKRWEENREKLKLENRIRSKELTVNLHDRYIKRLLTTIYGFNKEEIPHDLIEFQRTKMLIKRLLREIKSND